MLNNKRECLATAAEIAKEYAGGGNLGLGTVSDVLQDVYNKPTELMEDAEKR